MDPITVHIEFLDIIIFGLVVGFSITYWGAMLYYIARAIHGISADRKARKNEEEEWKAKFKRMQQEKKASGTAAKKSEPKAGA